MVLRSVDACIDSGDWLQGSGMQESGFKSPGALMDRRLKPNGSEVALKCPRCDSPNTKFCYYNNYSLTQPRYFCKTCRRYWTKGGTLRNVPVGGGCRKNKRFKRPGDSQTSDASASASGQNNNMSNDHMNCSSSPMQEQSGLNLPPPVRSVYFTLLNGGADGLGISYSSSSASVQQQQHNSSRLDHLDRGVLRDNCNSNGTGTGVMIPAMMHQDQVPSTSNSTGTGTASHEALGSMSNLNTFQSPPDLIPEQAPSLVQINGDLSTIFEAARHHHQNQQVPTSSSAPTFSHVSGGNSNRFNDVTGVVNDHRLNNSHALQDQAVHEIQWQHQHHHHHHKFTIPVEDHHGNGAAAQVLLPFDHESHHHQVRAPHHDESKLRHLIMDGVHTTTPLPGGEVIEENNGHVHVDASPYNWQLPTSEGLLDTSANNLNYWNGTAGAWPDLTSCYAPYTNPLI